MRISYLETARIAESLAQLLHASVPTARIFEVLARHRYSRRARKALEELRCHVVDLGHPFHDGLSAKTHLWPRYFIELVRCAERAGLLYAGFVEGADHFRKLVRVRRAAHMLWMGATSIIVFGWLARCALRTWFLGLNAGWGLFEHGIRSALPPVILIVIFLYVPVLRRLVDQLVLGLPIISETVYDLCLYQFTTCFRYLYIGAVSAPDIARMSGVAMGNSYLSRRVSSAADLLATGSSFSEALRPKINWPANYIERLAQAELTGQLEPVLENLARERREALEMRVEVTRRIVEPLVAYAIVSAIALEIYTIACALAARGQVIT